MLQTNSDSANDDSEGQRATFLALEKPPRTVPSKVTASQKRLRKSCWFCRQDYMDSTLIEFFENYLLDPRVVDRDEVLAEILRRDERISADTDIPAMVRKGRMHFAKHWSAQPFPGHQILRRRRDTGELEEGLTGMEEELVAFMSQVRLATPEQLAEIFNPGGPGLSDARRVEAMLRIVASLATRSLLYRQQHRGNGRPTVKTVYLGKGAELLLGPHRVAWTAPVKPADTSGFYVHDLGTTEIFVALHRSLGEGELQWGKVRVSMQLRNCWAGKPLAMGFQVNPRPGESDKLGPLNVRPDGLTVLGVDFLEPSKAPGGRASVGLPLLLEHDTGSKKPWDLADQIANHELLGRSGAPAERITLLDDEGQRVKGLDVPGYALPLLISTRGFWGSQETNRQRLAKVRREFGKEMKRRGYRRSEVSPKFLVDADDLDQLGVHAPVYNLLEPKQEAEARRTLIEELFIASKALIKSGNLDAQTLLHLNSKAARELGRRGDRQALSRRQLREQEAEEQRIEHEVENYRREFEQTASDKAPSKQDRADELAAMRERLHRFREQGGDGDA